MITEDEKKFIVYWKVHRDIENKTFKQWLVGLPLGLLFGLPIIINFFSGWYKRANMELNAKLSNHDFNPMVLIVAFILIVSFVAVFSKRHKWDMHEQRYRELLSKQEKEVKELSSESN